MEQKTQQDLIKIIEINDEIDKLKDQIKEIKDNCKHLDYIPKLNGIFVSPLRMRILEFEIKRKMSPEESAGLVLEMAKEYRENKNEK